MKIMIDSEPLLAEQLTGIGYNLAETADAYAAAFPEDELVFSAFAFRDVAKKRERLKAHADRCAEGKGSVKLCRLFPAGAYRLAWGLCHLPLPYRLFFGGADITHFYNFLIPPAVKGKKVCTVHDLAFRSYPETVAKRTRMLLGRQLGKTLKRADSVVVVSEFTKTELLKYYPWVDPQRVYVVYNGVDSRYFYPRTYTERSRELLGGLGLERGKYFFYLGTIEPRKNLARMIEAYAVAVGRIRECGGEVYPLVLGGRRGWYYDEILAKAGELGVEELVRFIGYVSREDMAELYTHCCAFVFPSLYEGFGIPVAEAMACGAAVITSMTSSLPEVGGDAALYCDPLDTSSVADAFFRMATEPDTVRVCRERGRAQAERFTWESAANALRRVYSETLGRK